MTAIFLQILGNFLIVSSVITQNLSDMCFESSFSVSEESKQKRIKNTMKTKWLIVFVFSYVILGLLLSVPQIVNFISENQLLNRINKSYTLNIVIIVLLCFLALVATKLIIKSSSDKIKSAVKTKEDGEMWIE